VTRNVRRNSLGRGEFLKAATACTLATPGAASARAACISASDPSESETTERKEHPMSIGGYSPSRLDRMHEEVAGYVKRGELLEVVYLIGRRSEVHVDAIGSISLGGKEPMRRDTIFRIASMTKPIVAITTMILVEECRLRLDKPVDRLLPELADRRVLKRINGLLDDTVPASRPITTRDLLT
jgi:CubicO group peptidase (beta-lactamase class C family)